MNQIASADPPQAPGLRHRYIDAGGLRVHLAEAGEGEPILLLHGWPQHHYMWRGVMARLAPSYRLLAPDLRGFGWTAAPGKGYDGETFARDQIALLDALGVDRVKVIGHDWGGWTSFLLGLRHPDRIDRMIVCNAPHPWPRVRARTLSQIPRSFYAAINAAPVLGPLLHRRTWMPRAAFRFGLPDGIYTEEEIAAFVESFRDPARAQAMSELYRYYYRVFAETARGGFRDMRLTVPTLMLFGSRDRFISEQLIEAEVGELADELRFEYVPDAGHFIVDEKPDLVSERAREFFSAGAELTG
jgi:pimeloyl-ACP methyl ester carboxylesterase